MTEPISPPPLGRRVSDTWSDFSSSCERDLVKCRNGHMVDRYVPQRTRDMSGALGGRGGTISDRTPTPARSISTETTEQSRLLHHVASAETIMTKVGEVDLSKAPKGPATQRTKRHNYIGFPFTPNQMSKILQETKTCPYVFITGASVPPQGTTIPHLRKKLLGVNIINIAVNVYGYYITFENSDDGRREAQRCINKYNSSRLFNYTMHMSVCFGNQNISSSGVGSSPTTSVEAEHLHAERAGRHPGEASPTWTQNSQLPAAMRMAHAGEVDLSVNNSVLRAHLMNSNPRLSWADSAPRSGRFAPSELSITSSEFKAYRCHVCEKASSPFFNQLIECASCLRRYHSSCHRPSITDQETKQGLWQCSRCRQLGRPISHKRKREVVENLRAMDVAIENRAHKRMKLGSKPVSENQHWTSTSGMKTAIPLQSCKSTLKRGIDAADHDVTPVEEVTKDQGASSASHPHKSKPSQVDDASLPTSLPQPLMSGKESSAQVEEPTSEQSRPEFTTKAMVANNMANLPGEVYGVFDKPDSALSDLSTVASDQGPPTNTGNVNLGSRAKVLKAGPETRPLASQIPETPLSTLLEKTIRRSDVNSQQAKAMTTDLDGNNVAESSTKPVSERRDMSGEPSTLQDVSSASQQGPEGYELRTLDTKVPQRPHRTPRTRDSSLLGNQSSQGQDISTVESSPHISYRAAKALGQSRQEPTPERENAEESREGPALASVSPLGGRSVTDKWASLTRRAILAGGSQGSSKSQICDWVMKNAPELARNEPRFRARIATTLTGFHIKKSKVFVKQGLTNEHYTSHYWGIAPDMSEPLEKHLRLLYGDASVAAVARGLSTAYITDNGADHPQDVCSNSHVLERNERDVAAVAAQSSTGDERNELSEESHSFQLQGGGNPRQKWDKLETPWQHDTLVTAESHQSHDKRILQAIEDEIKQRDFSERDLIQSFPEYRLENSFPNVEEKIKEIKQRPSRKMTFGKVLSHARKTQDNIHMEVHRRGPVTEGTPRWVNNGHPHPANMKSVDEEQIHSKSIRELLGLPKKLKRTLVNGKLAYVEQLPTGSRVFPVACIADD